jgi:hypothetical protein
MFRKNKWQEWWDNLPERDKVYLSSQPLWYDRDLYKAMAWGGLLGFLFGLMF